jgi:sulfate adenylyltransferase subunit 2
MTSERSQGGGLSVPQLNARRREAVQLRLQGMTLADVAARTGLSVPTVIAAHKAFREKGWAGVAVQPRLGRPPKAAPRSADDPALGDALWTAIQGPADGGALWTVKAVGEWLARMHDLCLSAGSVQRICDRAGLPLRGGLPEPPPAAGAGVARFGMAVLPVRERGLHLLAARSARGQLFWLAVPRAPLSTDYVDFLSRLAGAAGQPVLAALRGARALAAVADLQAWLAAQDGRVALVEPPQARVAASVPATGAPTVAPSATTPPGRNHPMTLTHLQRLEAESIHIMREVVAEADNPVMLYSVGKDSAVMLHLAMKAFYPAKPPFPLLHVDTRWKFRDMYAMRDRMARELGMKLLVHINPEGVAKDINPFTHGSAIHTDIMKTEGLKQALDTYGFDAAFGGARRDEEKSRAKERIFSFRTSQHRWDPKNQRPELWRLYNARKHKGESMRVFPLSNWTELDIWQYIHLQNIPIVPLYFAAERPVVERDGTLIMVDDERMPLNPGEVPMMRKVRFRTLGCYPLTGAVESEADTLPRIIQEMLLARTSERQGRVIDHDSAASMEKKKQEGYF